MVEILVAMVILSLVVGASYTMINQGTSITSKLTGQVSMRNDARMILTEIVTQIQKGDTNNISYSTELGFLVETNPSNHIKIPVRENGSVTYISYWLEDNSIIKKIGDGKEQVFLRDVQNLEFLFDKTENGVYTLNATLKDKQEVFDISLKAYPRTTIDSDGSDVSDGVLAYSFQEQVQDADIRKEDKLIIARVNSDANLENLIATFNFPNSISVTVEGDEQISGVTSNDFSDSIDNPVVYMVTDKDGKTTYWRVVVSQEGNDKQGGDGVVLYVNSDGDTQPMPFENVIHTTDEDENWTKLIITSNIGIQTHDDLFDFYAPEGIIIESGVELHTENSSKTHILLKADSGDIVLEEGVKFGTTGNNNNENEQLVITTGGNIDIRGTTLVARRYIEIIAGENIYAQDANLEITTNSVENHMKLSLDPTGGTIYIENLMLEFGRNSSKAEITPDDAIEGDLREGSNDIE